MRRGFVALAGALVLCATPAPAADLSATVAQQPAAVTSHLETPFNWSGMYFGVNGGYGFGQSKFDYCVFGGCTPTPDFDINGWVAGGTAGVNWQHGNLVLGIEGDFDGSNISGSILCDPPNLPDEQ